MFSRYQKSKDGFNFYCKDCCDEYRKKYIQTPEGIWNSIKGRQKYYNKHNLPPAKPVIIKKKEFIEWYNNEPKICAYCDIPEDQFILLKRKYGSRTLRLTVDCKNNDVGYAKGNIVLACERCNFIKSNLFDFEIMREIGQKYIKPLWQKLIIGKFKSTIYLTHTKEG